MPKRKTTATTTAAPEYIPTPADACNEAAARINVVLYMLQSASEPTQSDTDGFEFPMMRDALEAIRDLLLQSAAAGGVR